MKFKGLILLTETRYVATTKTVHYLIEARDHKFRLFTFVHDICLSRTVINIQSTRQVIESRLVKGCDRCIVFVTTMESKSGLNHSLQDRPTNTSFQGYFVVARSTLCQRVVLLNEAFFVQRNISPRLQTGLLIVLG